MDFWTWGTAPTCKVHGLPRKVPQSHVRIAGPSIVFYPNSQLEDCAANKKVFFTSLMIIDTPSGIDFYNNVYTAYIATST